MTVRRLYFGLLARFENMIYEALLYCGLPVRFWTRCAK